MRPRRRRVAGVRHRPLHLPVADLEALIGYRLQAAALLRFNTTMLSLVTINGTQVFSPSLLGDEELWWLGGALVHEPPRIAGEAVVSEGDTDEKLYIIRRGVAAISTAKLGEAVRTALISTEPMRHS